MELTLDTFNQGLANRLRPHLLPEGYSQELRDADIVDGSLRPFNGTKAVGFTGPQLTYQNGAGTRSIEKWGDYYYWSDNDTGEIGSSLGYVGVAAPQTRASANPKVEGDRFVGDYQYLFTFQTDKGVESSAFASLSLSEAKISVRTSYELPAEALDAAPPFSPSRIHPADGKRRGYTSGEVVSYHGTNWLATHEFVGYLSKEDRYPYRYVVLAEWQYPGADNGEFWIDLSDNSTVEIGGYQQIELTSIPQPTESAVNKINIYRTANSGNNFYLVAGVGVGTRSFTDTAADASILVNRQLAIGFTFPPLYVDSNDANNTVAQVGGRYLTEQNGTFYLAYGDRVYLSNPGDPHTWDINRYVELGSTVTALAKEDRGVVAMTSNRTYHLTGTTAADISARWIPNFQGCPNWRTVSYVHDVPVWLSNDGVTVFGYEPNVNVERLQVVTEKKHAFPDDITHGAVANDVYYLFRPDGTAVCVDFRRELAIYERTLPSEFAIADENRDRLLLRYQNQTYEVGAGDPLTWTWRSAELTLANRNVSTGENKKVRSIYVDADSNFTLRVFSDGMLHSEIMGMVGARRSRRVYTRGLFCHHLTIEIESAGEVRHVSVEYFTTQKQR